jgi:hypothetical protein
MDRLRFLTKVPKMEIHRMGSTFGAVLLAISLLFGAVTAQAATVILDGNNNVTRIDNLQVFDDLGGPVTYDVYFVYGRGVDVYGSNFNFDFPDEDAAYSAQIAVSNALNEHSPTPVGAGPKGTAQFFIGTDLEDGNVIVATGGEVKAGIWDECDIDCLAGAALLPADKVVTYADFRPPDGTPPPPSDTVNLSGEVENAGGTPLCAMVLASGQYEFSCNPNGPFSLNNLPRESNGSVKRQVYVDGFFPNVKELQGSATETVVMQKSGSCTSYNQDYNPTNSPGSAGQRVNISGMILLQNSGTPVCAMVLANGQYQFSCDGSGSYALNIPLDGNGQFKLQVYADGFAPITQKYDQSSVMNNVRLARASECL